MIELKSFYSLATNRSLRVLVPLSFALVILAFILTTYYLAWNEVRVGYQLYDPILAAIDPIDLSRPLFICTYGCLILGLIFCMTTPEKVILANLSILCILTYRSICMFLVPLEPPQDIIPLQDEFLRHTTYGDKVLLKDLFFSGHTASVVLVYHLVEHKRVSQFLLLMSGVIGSMLIIQHVHYTIDVLVAYAFAHLSFRSGIVLTGKALLYSRFLFLSPVRPLRLKEKLK